MSYIIGLVIQVLILARLSTRFGFSPFWAGMAIVPLGPIILLWIIALSKWDFPDARELSTQGHDSDELVETFE